jgi:hypothetical protein
VVGRHLEPFGLHRGARRVGPIGQGRRASEARPPCLSPGAVCARSNLGNPRYRTQIGSVELSIQVPVVRIRFRHSVVDPLIRSGIQPEESGPSGFSIGRPVRAVGANARLLPSRDSRKSDSWNWLRGFAATAHAHFAMRDRASMTEYSTGEEGTLPSRERCRFSADRTMPTRQAADQLLAKVASFPARAGCRSFSSAFFSI